MMVMDKLNAHKYYVVFLSDSGKLYGTSADKSGVVFWVWFPHLKPNLTLSKWITRLSNVLRFCTEHNGITAVLCATLQNDLTTEIDVLDERDFARVHDIEAEAKWGQWKKITGHPEYWLVPNLNAHLSSFTRQALGYLPHNMVLITDHFDRLEWTQYVYYSTPINNKDC